MRLKWAMLQPDVDCWCEMQEAFIKSLNRGYPFSEYVLHIEGIEAIWRMKPDSRITSTAAYALGENQDCIPPENSSITF